MIIYPLQEDKEVEVSKSDVTKCTSLTRVQVEKVAKVALHSILSTIHDHIGGQGGGGQ